MELSTETIDGPYQPHYFVVEPEDLKEERKMLFKEEKESPNRANDQNVGDSHNEEEYDLPKMQRENSGSRNPSEEDYYYSGSSHYDEDYDQPKIRVTNSCEDESYRSPKITGESVTFNEDYDQLSKRDSRSDNSPTNAGDIEVLKTEFGVLDLSGDCLNEEDCAQNGKSAASLPVDVVFQEQQKNQQATIDSNSQTDVPPLPPKCKIKNPDVPESTVPPVIPPKKNQKSTAVISARQTSYLDFTTDDMYLERIAEGDTDHYELPCQQEVEQKQPPGYASVIKIGHQKSVDLSEDLVVNEFTTATDYTTNEIYSPPPQLPPSSLEALCETYKTLPLPERPWQSIQSDKSVYHQDSTNIDMRNYTPLVISPNSYRKSHSVESSMSDVIGTIAYEKDTSLGLQSHPENKKESYYASLVTLSKRDVETRKENLLKPCYVVSIGVGHVDLRKKLNKRESKTLEFFRALSMSAGHSPTSSNQRESLLIAWKLGN